MSDNERGKRMIEEIRLDEVLDAYAVNTGRNVTDEGTDGFPRIEGSPDFVLGFDGRPLGIEIARVKGADDAEAYFETMIGIAWKKHESYERRGLFRHPIALLLYSDEPPLFEISAALGNFAKDHVFDDLGFVEVWAADLSDAYFSPSDPARPPDMFCMKPKKWFGFHRIGAADRKPWG
jgi:hypothetical protein